MDKNEMQNLEWTNLIWKLLIEIFNMMIKTSTIITLIDIFKVHTK
jgi:hypothetical protein